MTSAIATSASSAFPALSVSDPSADRWRSRSRGARGSDSLASAERRWAATSPVMRNAARTSQSSARQRRAVIRRDEKVKARKEGERQG